MFWLVDTDVSRMPKQQASLRDYGTIRAATCAVNGIEQITTEAISPGVLRRLEHAQWSEGHGLA